MHAMQVLPGIGWVNMLMEPVRRHHFQIAWHLQPLELMFKVTKPCCVSQRAYRDLIALSCQELKHTQII